MFVLNIPPSFNTLNTIKAELTRKLPDVKSSHRCEAIARGLGFRTHAAAIAAAKLGSSGTVIVRGDLFANYLAEHGFIVQPKWLYHAAAKVALLTVSERVPNLTMWGIGVGQPRGRQSNVWESIREMNNQFQQNRAMLIGDGAADAFLTCLAFLRHVTPTKTIRPSTGSYWLKHIAENYTCTYPEGDELGPTYVANGVLIAAALHSGFKMKSSIDDLGYHNVNVSFNMSKSCLEDLDCEIRPDGAIAQTRRAREKKKQYRRNGIVSF